MSKELILKMSISVDGFVGGPSGESDWIFKTSTPDSVKWLVDLISTASLHAIGHKSYEMADYWPIAQNAFAKPMNEIPKAVFSRSGSIPTPAMEKVSAAIASGEATVDQAVLDSWKYPTMLGKDLVADINRLKAEDGGPIISYGGAGFATSLIAAGLVDVFCLVVHPVVFGRGLPIFAGMEKPLDLKLEELVQFEGGAVVKKYRPA